MVRDNLWRSPRGIKRLEARHIARRSGKDAHLVTPVGAEHFRQVKLQRIAALQPRIGDGTGNRGLGHGAHSPLERLIYKPQLAREGRDSLGAELPRHESGHKIGSLCAGMGARRFVAQSLRERRGSHSNRHD